MLLNVVREFASTQPQRSAIVSIGKKPLSYARMYDQIEAIGRQLRLGGLTRSARIGLALLDGPEAVLAILAVACHATVVPVNNSLGAEDLRLLFDHAELDAIIVADTTPFLVHEVARDCGLQVIESFSDRGQDIACNISVSEQSNAKTARSRPPSIALILNTSGTTGRPKLVPITHSNLLAEAAKMRDWFNLTPDDCCLSALPLCYAHGLREILFPPILTGGSIARPANHTQLDIITWLRELKPSWYSTFPIFHRAIFEMISANEADRPEHGLRFILSAGTPLDPELQKGLQSVLGIPWGINCEKAQ